MLANLDSDRYADLAVGAPGDTVGSPTGAGSERVSRPQHQRHQDHAVERRGSRHTRESDGFGTSLAVVPVQKSSQNNLIIGIPGEGVTTDPGAEGYLTQLADKPSGPSGLGSISFSLNTPGIQGTATSPSQFGALVG